MGVQPPPRGQFASAGAGRVPRLSAAMTRGVMPRYRRAHDMENWKTDARIADRGFNHAYDGVVEDGNGEDFFLDLVDEYLTEATDLLDVGCGHGDLTLQLA